MKTKQLEIIFLLLKQAAACKCNQQLELINLKEVWLKNEIY